MYSSRAEISVGTSFDNDTEFSDTTPCTKQQRTTVYHRKNSTKRFKKELKTEY